MPDQPSAPGTRPDPQPAVDDFSTLFAFLPIGAYRSSPEGRQLRANPALVRLNGYTSEAEQLAGVHDINAGWYVQPGRRDEFRRLLERDGMVRGFESEIWRHKTRERIWISENAHVVRDPQGRALYYEGTVEEITDRVRERQALQSGEQRLRQIMNLVPGVIYLLRVDPQGRSTLDYLSPNVQPILGVTAEELLADPMALRALRHPEDRERVQAEFLRTFSQRLPLDVQYRVLRPDGSERWIRQTHVIAPPEDGCELRIGLMLDITEQQQAEQALRANSQLWKDALESTGDGVWDWDFVTGVDEYSPRCKAMYGFAPDELPDVPQALDERTHPDDVAGMLRDRQAHFEGRTPRYVNEHRVRCKDGRWMWVLSRGVVISRDAQGRPLRMIGTHTDITERKQAEELRRQRDMAQAADQAKSQFLSRVSHELRTPLNAVLGFAQLLEMDAAIGADPRLLGWVRQVLASGRHLLGLMDDILDISSAQGGELPVRLQAVSLAPLLEDAWKMVAAGAQDAELAYSTRIPATLPPVAADGKRLRQVLVNLLSNAVKYNRRGGWVQVSAAVLDGRVQLSVADSGQGFGPEQQSRLFRPFERLGAHAGTVPGTGLGLALSRQLMLAMGGDIQAESTPGQGSVFRLLLPVADPAVPDEPVTAPGVPPAPPLPPPEPPRQAPSSGTS